MKFTGNESLHHIDHKSIPDRPGATRATNGPGANFLMGPLPFAVSKHKDNILVK